MNHLCHRIALTNTIWMTIALLVCSIATAPVTDAQQPAVHGRQRIGLALEGGGALGFAHIGVLEWMEDHHIPVDDVAGTSMGGLVGGLYAAGNSPKDIAQFVGSIDWSTVLGGQAPFETLSYRRKEDRVAFPNRLEFGFKHGFGLPSGLNSGAAVGLLLDRQMLPYYDLKDFDDLPIPFRCVATEMVSGTAHVFHDGSVAQAMRATMAIPGVFAPVTHGNDVYSDGMAVDNLPVDVARRMGADVVIAVYLDTGTVDRKSLNSLVGVAGRNLSIMVAANEKANMANADILLKADVSKFTSGDFTKSTQIIPLGYKVAQEHAAELEKYALSDADWNAYVAQRNARRRTTVPVPAFIDVYGLSGAQKAEVENEFTKFVGHPLDIDQVDATINVLLGTGTYDGISFNMIEMNGKTGLLVRPRTKAHAPPFLNVGITLSSNNTNNVLLGVGARATYTDITGPGSELRLDGAVGPLAGLTGELYKPIHFLHFRKGYFVASRAYLTYTTAYFFSGSNQLSQYREHRNGFGVDGGYQFNTRTELRVGEDYQWYGDKRAIGEPEQKEFSLRPWVTSTRLQYLGQDNVQVPTRGSIVQSSLSYYTQRPNRSGGYAQMNTYLAHFMPVKERGIVAVTLNGGTSFRAQNLGLAGFELGGPLRLSAYERGELLGDDYFLVQAGYLHQLTTLSPVIGDAIYAAGFYEMGKTWNGPTGTPSLPNDFAAGLVIKTLIGPMYGGLSIGDSDHRKWFFGLGRVF
ncbi:patatin-like phospholipase family protein [Edaphobacter sp.]|uniref:patatin-like phospholipase family protein n=1 Tax=Edaphobacter sp. TaxID=1934404 RepID=UPI002DB65B6B|nr:patatin-like phospholipase family protein [Edaphobacter sp.]HEU5340352.1 patatin-like phospholipase family protein [Edaphobacter sp.]